MQIVIELDEYVLEHCKRHVRERYANNIEEAIAKGTVLPKGHGRLIDADSLRAGYNIDLEGNLVGYRYITKRDIDNAPTILEADKERRRDEAN